MQKVCGVDSDEVAAGNFFVPTFGINKGKLMNRRKDMTVIEDKTRGESKKTEFICTEMEIKVKLFPS